MSNVLAFRARPAAPAPAPLPAMPPAEEIAAALLAIDRAVVALGELDFEGLYLRVLAAMGAEADAEPDNSADAEAQRRALEANALISASAFRGVVTTIARLRAEG